MEDDSRELAGATGHVSPLSACVILGGQKAPIINRRGSGTARPLGLDDRKGGNVMRSPSP